MLEPYHLAWWSRKIRGEPILTGWNRSQGAIFIHIPKTAGTSLLDALGADPVFDTHAPALTYREADPELFARAFKFTIVRDPWDRFASAFHFLKSGTDWPMQQAWAARYIADLSFAQFVRKLRNPLFRQIVLSERFFWPQTFWIADRNGNVIVDEVYRFEELDAAIGAIADRLGVPAPTETPRRRKAARADSHVLYEDEEMVALVRKLYADDVHRFGYQFAPA